MGLAISKLFDFLTGKKEARILMMGLDAAGKTTILYKLKLGKVITTIPTIGFNVETVKYKNINFTVWDIGNRGNLKPLWVHYYPNTQALIFSIDSSDRERIDEAKDEFYRVLNHELLKGVPLLVFANKKDIAVMGSEEIIERLDLKKMEGREWFIQETSAITGEGLSEGLTWLSKAVTKKN